MRRKRQVNEDSLELLLDTICNVFGGIVFIAILVALLTSAKTDDVKTHDQSQSEVLKNQLQADQLQAQINTVQLAITQLKQTRKTMDDAGQTTSLLNALDQIRSDDTAAQAQIEKMKQWIDQFDQIDSKQSNQAEQAHRQAQEQVNVLAKAVAKTDSAEQIQGRLPQTRVTTKNQALFLIRKNRLYWVPSKGSEVLNETARKDDVRIDEQRGSLLITTNPNGGFIVNANAKLNKEMHELFTLMNSEHHFFDLYVAADGIHTFQELKKMLLIKGFDYNVHPLDHDEPYVFGLVDSVSTQ